MVVICIHQIGSPPEMHLHLMGFICKDNQNRLDISSWSTMARKKLDNFHSMQDVLVFKEEAETQHDIQSASKNLSQNAPGRT
ncbi:MAG: hypothetical protein AUJ92_03475 [Armatimonadetes bacterium CG2_30_59_28]|nr:MAG: hypothetical protein AUJ92_03475 [Armatimonadetes bacterium CG2_30_59_28]